jgi:hypothetical protein
MAITHEQAIEEYENSSKDAIAREKLRKDLAAPDPAKRPMPRLLAFLGDRAGVMGMAAVGLLIILAVIAIAVVMLKMGPDSWKTIEGGRAILLIALTAAFVTFGGALTLSPLFEAGPLEERFRRAREIFLLFAGMFSTVVGFYFASATNQGQAAQLLAVETFDVEKGELEVSVAGGKPEYLVEIEYGAVDQKKKKTKRQTLGREGSATFTFDKSQDWPESIVVRATDANKNQSRPRTVSTEKAQLETWQYKPPAPSDAAEKQKVEPANK